MSKDDDLARLVRHVNSTRGFTIRDRAALKNLIGERDNYRDDAIAYMNTISEADEDVHYLRRKLAVAYLIINRAVPGTSVILNDESRKIYEDWCADMRSIGIEPSDK